jgi:PAS domain S-box-containing protein
VDTGRTRPGDDARLRLALQRARVMVDVDWRQTPIGPPETWSAALRTVLQVVLASRYPMWLAWGPELTFLCNDACRPLLGPRDSWAVGSPAQEVWAEIWDHLGPRIERIVGGGEASWDERERLLVDHEGVRRETYRTSSLSPIVEGDGPAGLLCVMTEETERVIDSRRLGLLRDVAAAMASARTEADVFAALRACLEREGRDVPFALAYRCEAGDGRMRAVRAMAAGFGGDPDPAFGAEGVEGDRSPWPIAQVWSSGATVQIDGLRERLGDLPTGAWREPADTALVVPVGPPGQPRPYGVLVAGVNPHRPLDPAYRAFVDRLAAEVGAATASARAFQGERRRAEVLTEVDHARTRFFAHVSHEFRTPLTLMAGPLAELVTDPRLPGDMREQLMMVQRNGTRLLKLVNTMLDFARIEAGRMDASFEPTDLARSTAELAAVFRSVTDRAGIELTIDCVPSGEVHVDRDMWEKIVLNLLSNAFKFTLAGSITVRVAPTDEPGVDRGEGCVAVEVSDTGIGIPAEELPRLFDRFHRVEGARGRTHEGAGIGLTLVWELVRLHGGAVTVHSEPGLGSTFRLVLPRGTAHVPRPSIGSPIPVGPSSVGANAWVEEAVRWLPAKDDPSAEAARGDLPTDDDKPRILLADDNSDMREYVRRLLERRYRVHAVADGAEALVAARAEPPDLVLSDVMMPNLDGFGLLAALRRDERTSAIPVVLLSARAGDETRAEGLEAGADDYLIKPFTARELLARVSGLLALVEVRHAAARSEAELRADGSRVLDAVTDGFVLLDVDCRVVHVNPRAEEAFGQPTSALSGRSLWELLPELAGTEAEERLRTVVRRRQPERFEAWLASWRQWLDLQCLPAAEGGVALFLCDITARRRTAMVLAGQAKALQLAVDGAPMPDVLDVLVRTVGVQGPPSLVASILLPSPDGRRLCHVAGTVHRDAFDWALEGLPLSESGCIGAAIASGDRVVSSDLDVDPSARALRAVTAEAGIRSCWAVPVHSAAGRTLGALVIWDRRVGRPDAADLESAEIVARTAAIVVERDLEQRERQLAARALRESEARFRKLADDAPGMVWVTEADGGCTYLSRSWYDFTGQPPATGLGFGWLEAAHPEDRATAEVAYREAHRQQDAFRLEYRIRRADGVYRWAMDAASPRFDPEGQFLGFVGSLIDITDRKLAEVHQQSVIEAERAARTQAERVNRMKDEFLATLSHELRTPLNAIHGWAQLLGRGGAAWEPETLQRGLEAIERNARAQKRMIEDLLDMSRIISGKVRLDLQPTDLADVLEQSLQSVQPAAEARGVLLEREIGDVPLVLGDPGRLQQVIWNLLTNAIKFTEPGGRVSVRLEGGESVRLVVADDGVGIAADFLPSVFDRFRQADGSASRRHTGLGLGLSIVKQLVELHGGEVHAYSSGEGCGSTFSLTLPAGRGLEEEPRDPTEATPTRSSGTPTERPSLPALTGIRILVVDDDPDARDLVRRLLSAARAEVTTAGSAREALSALERDNPTLLISDIGMPGQDGYDLIRSVRARGPDGGGRIPAIALTAFARAQDRDRALAAGYQAHLTKPIDPHELVSACRTLAEGR